jgi:hypothetical protein
MEKAGNRQVRSLLIGSAARPTREYVFFGHAGPAEPRTVSFSISTDRK